MRICIKYIETLKQTNAVKGAHIMAIGCEEKTPEIIDSQGCFRPKYENET